jgi:hypothetical protein
LKKPGEEVPIEGKTQKPVGKMGRLARSCFLILKIGTLLLIFGAGAVGGLYAGGGLFPILDRVIPWMEQVPAVGPRMASLLRKIPGPPSSSQRRFLELQEREEFLDAKEKALEEEKERIEKQKKSAQQPEKVAEKAQAKPALSEAKAAESSKADFLLESTFSEMPPSKAARILALMEVSEIGPVFERMDPDWRAQVLGKMPPKDAARFLRYLNGNRPSSVDAAGR